MNIDVLPIYKSVNRTFLNTLFVMNQIPTESFFYFLFIRGGIFLFSVPFKQSGLSFEKRRAVIKHQH